MTKDNKPLNSHIEEYLDYYCDLCHAPEFAVLLKGKWGSGKTWFIEQYRKKLKENNKKCLYVSLYGMTKFSEIEDEFFRQLHPILSSKGMAITSKIAKSFLKGTLKIDLDGDSKDDGNLSIQIPDVNIPDYLKNADESILIFDDLERCKIDISNILGYINFFVEHQGLKVILIANEDELVIHDRYNQIKEKLIGKTFCILPDFNNALLSFVDRLSNELLKNFLRDRTQLIQNLYIQSEYENLRNLKQIILEFERLFEKLPEKAKNKSEFLQDILQILMAFSIEIKRGNMLAEDISKLQNPYISRNSDDNNSMTVALPGSNSVDKEKEGSYNSLKTIIKKYDRLNLYYPFPSLEWWQSFLDKGIIDLEKLERSLVTSKYFQDENTPNWARLWHFTDLMDDEFEPLLQKVELEYQNRHFNNIQEIKHITGIFLDLSANNLYKKDKQDILQEAKLYIDWLKKEELLDLNLQWLSNPSCEYQLNNYIGLVFQGIEIEEFKVFCSYIDKVRQSARLEKMPDLGQELLALMKQEPWKFPSIICLNDINTESTIKYYDIPIFQYIQPDRFIQELIQVKIEDRRTILYGIKKRYELDNINKKLLEELDWLKSVRDLLLEESKRREEKISGYCLKSLIETYLDEAIKNLEKENRDEK